ncbi:ketopantoate reductase family protein [Xylanimonas ulmi]|nr:2-dehydropantoate 2-reductase [Xylanibacterium ulmi]
MGCGAMGSVYASRLARGGHDVLVVDAWADHVRAIAERGLSVRGPDGAMTARVRAFEAPPARVVDLVVLAVKAADVVGAARGVAPLLGPHTLVLTIQNGLGSAQEVAGVLGPERLLVGVASGFGASLVGPGQVRHNAMRALRFGAYAPGAGPGAPQVERIARAWRQGGFDATAVDDVVATQWEKLICNVAYSAPCALTGLTVGEVMDHPHLGEVSRAAAVEAWETATAAKVRIDVADPVTHVREFGARLPDAKPSALLDHLAGRRSEIPVINGAIPREAAKVGLTAPVNATLTALVLAREDGL